MNKVLPWHQHRPVGKELDKTSDIERFNNTFRQRCSRLVRKSLSFSKKLENITLIPLPPASPVLNPTEQVWQTLRENSLANRCFKDEEDIVNACCEAWNSFDEKAGAVKSLCTRSWADLIN